MATVATSDFKAGLKIIIDKEPCEIIENEFVKPGKGQAFNRVRFKKLISQKVIERTFKSGEVVELADIVEQEMAYLYADDEFFHFMNNESFEQLAIDIKTIGTTKKWLVEQDICSITLYNNNPILVKAPNFVELEITQTDPGLKGDTAGTGGKPATLKTGAVVRIPLFVQQGEIIKVDTRDASYVERAKKKS